MVSLRMADIKATSALKSFTGSHLAPLLIECTHVALIGQPLCQDKNNHAGNSAVDSDLPSQCNTDTSLPECLCFTLIIHPEDCARVPLLFSCFVLFFFSQRIESQSNSVILYVCWRQKCILQWAVVSAFLNVCMLEKSFGSLAEYCHEKVL